MTDIPFKVGDRVECVDNDESGLVKRAVYTVAEVRHEPRLVRLEESRGTLWSLSRFRLLTSPERPAGPKKAAAAIKPPLHLNPPVGDVLQAYAHLNGAKKYGAFNWRASEGVELMTYLGAIKRHVAAIVEGEDMEIDPFTGVGVDHLGAIMATAAIIADARKHGKLIDDRPKG